MVEAASLATRDAVAAGVSNLETIRLEYWDFVQPSTTARVFPDGFPGAALEHAAVQETSLSACRAALRAALFCSPLRLPLTPHPAAVLALRPDLVDLSLMPGARAVPALSLIAPPPLTVFLCSFAAGAGAYPADRPAAFPPYTFEPPESRPEWAPFSGVLSPANGASLCCSLPSRHIPFLPVSLLPADRATPRWRLCTHSLPRAAASIEKGTWLLADHVDGIVGALRAEWGADPLAGLLSA